MEKIKTIVNIAGKDYKLIGDDSKEHIHRVALCVNEKMRELKSGSKSKLNAEMLAVLTALNIADDYVRLKDELEGVKKELEKAKKDSSVTPITAKRR